MNRNPRDERSASRAYLLIYLLLFIGITVTGYISFHSYARHYRKEVERQLSAIAELKSDGLVQWRRERLADAEYLIRNPSFAALTRRTFAGNDPEARRQVLNWLAGFNSPFLYDQARLLDTKGETVLSVPTKRPPASAAVRARLPELFSKKMPLLVDFYLNDHDHRPYLALLIPILDDGPDSSALGAVALRIDPSVYLYPFIKNWPLPSNSAETLLVRREGNDVLFLNDLRFKVNTAMSLRSPLTDLRVPAVRAALGDNGIFEGVDYRGEPVIADVRSVPGSPWGLVSRMDSAEIFAPLRTRLRLTLAGEALLLITAGAGLMAVLRQQRLRNYREKISSAEALLKKEKNYRQLFETMTSGFALHEIILDDQGKPCDYRFIEINHAFEILTGLHSDQTLGRTVLEVLPATEQFWIDTYGKIALSGEPFRFEYYSGELGRHFEVSAYSPEHGQFATIIMDVTEQKKIIAEINRKNAELERFTYTLSHDLKSPLVTVKTFLSYLELDMANQDRDRVEQDMGYMRSATDKMARLLDELLEMVRVGRLVNASEPLIWGELVHEALDAVAGRIAERGVRIELEDTVINLCGDRSRLAEVWQNLIENSVKYMGEQSEPRIEIGATGVGRDTVFFVKDNGIGIETQYREKIFSLFEKLDPSVEGTGLGLALVKRIIELYDGRIWVESEGKGKGSTFFFTLPKAVQPV